MFTKLLFNRFFFSSILRFYLWWSKCHPNKFETQTLITIRFMLRILWAEFNLNRPSALNIVQLATESFEHRRIPSINSGMYVSLPNICIFPTSRIQNWRKIDFLIAFNIFHSERIVIILTCVIFCWFCDSNWFELFICKQFPAEPN